MLPGYSPTDRPNTGDGLQTGQRHVNGEVRRSSGKGAWIALAIVVLVVLAMIMLLSFMPETTTTGTTIPLTPDAPAG